MVSLRMPLSTELAQLRDYLKRAGDAEHDAVGWVCQAVVEVLENDQIDDPRDAGKVMLVVWSQADRSEAFLFRQSGHLVHLNQNPQLHRATVRLDR